MRTSSQYAGFAILLAASLVAATDAHAAKIKYTFLKVGNGERAQAYAFKSKSACEAAKRRTDAAWAFIIKDMKSRSGTKHTAPKTRCLDRKPWGFMMP